MGKSVVVVRWGCRDSSTTISERLTLLNSCTQGAEPISISPRQRFWWACPGGRAWCPGTPSTNVWRTPGNAGPVPLVCRVPGLAGFEPHSLPDTVLPLETVPALLPEYQLVLCSLALQDVNVIHLCVLLMVKQVTVTDEWKSCQQLTKNTRSNT